MSDEVDSFGVSLTPASRLGAPLMKRIWHQALTIPEVLQALHSGKYKEMAALATIDFLIRHGFITAENEPNYLEVAWRCRRALHVALRQS
jgi:hypothetical protein